MLNDSLLHYLRTVTSDAQFQTYQTLLPFLHTLNPTGFEFSLRQFESFNDDQVTIDNVAQFNHSILELMMEEIENFGFYISDTQPVADKVEFFGKVLMALYRIDQFEDLLTIKFILDAGHDIKETMAEILVLIDGTLTVEGIMEMTQDISPSLLSRIKELINDLEYSFEQTDINSVPKDAERIKAAIAFYAIEGAKRYFVEVGGANESIDNYLNYFFSLPNKHSAEEMAKLSLFSGIAAGLPEDQIKTKLGELLPFYITDSAALISVSRWVTKLSLPEATDVKA